MEVEEVRVSMEVGERRVSMEVGEVRGTGHLIKHAVGESGRATESYAVCVL